MAPQTPTVTRRHPYSNLAASAYWKSAVCEIPPYLVDPVTKPPFLISRSDRVATAGSCFAQHISKALRSSGFNYFVPESAPPGIAPNAVTKWGFEVFSARYGNVYTPRQLVQLFDRAYNDFQPKLSSWRESEDCFVDPFRPRIQSEPFCSESALLADRVKHLEAVRRMFQQLDVFIFTLGLTEAWLDRQDGAVIPLAPGVSGGVWDPARFEFRNFSLSEAEGDMLAFIDKLRAVNPRSKVILTVSPVPLAATFENRHVLCSNAISKSVLRLAAETCATSRPDVAYFPSYEIVTGPHSAGRYYGDDLRSTTQQGVDHVMRVFLARFTEDRSDTPDQRTWRSARTELDRLQDLVCDEDAISANAPEHSGGMP